MANSPGGIEIARLSARVLPDTSRLYDELRADLAEIEARASLNIKASVDSTRLVEETKAAVEEAQASAGEINIKAEVDKSQAQEASSAFSKLASSISFAGIAAGLLGPALVPLAAVLGGIVVALSAPIALAAGGATLFGFLAGFAVKQTEAQNKQIQTLKKSLDSAKQSLDNTVASAGTSASNSLASAQASAAASIKSAQSAAANASTAASQASAAQRIQAAQASLSAAQSRIAASQSASVEAAQRKYNEALLKYKAALDGLTPSQQKFLDAQNNLKTAFHELLAKIGPSLLGPITQAMNLLGTLLPSLSPIIVSFGKVFSGFLNDVADAAKTQAFKDLVHLIATDGSSALKLFGGLAGNLALAFGNFMQQFLPFGLHLVSDLDKGVGALERFSQTANAKGGLKDFVAYVQQNAPLVGHLITEILGALVGVFTTLATPGHLALVAITGIVGALTSLKGLAGPLASALAGFGIGAFFGGPQVGLAIGAVLGLVSAFKELYDHSKPLQQIIRDIGDYFDRTWLPLIKQAAEKVVPALGGAVKSISQTISQNKGLFETLGKALAAFAGAAVVAAILTVVEGIKQFAEAFKLAVAGTKLFVDVTIVTFQVVLKGVKVLVDTILASFGTIVNGAAAAFGWMPGIGPKVLKAQAAFNDFSSKVSASIDGASASLEALKREIDAVGQSHPKFQVSSNVLALIQQMHELDAFKFKDKSVKIDAIFEQQIERVRGVGGGIQRPSSSTTSGNNGRSAPLINVQNMNVADTHDMQRQLGNQVRSKAGGGVILSPPLTPSFAGVG